jgi:hypothetical protein
MVVSFIAQVPNVAYIKQRVKLLVGNLPVISYPYNWKEIAMMDGICITSQKRFSADCFKTVVLRF